MQLLLLLMKKTWTMISCTFRALLCLYYKLILWHFNIFLLVVRSISYIYIYMNENINEIFMKSIWWGKKVQFMWRKKNLVVHTSLHPLAYIFLCWVLLMTEQVVNLNSSSVNLTIKFCYIIMTLYSRFIKSFWVFLKQRIWSWRIL